MIPGWYVNCPTSIAVAVAWSNFVSRLPHSHPGRVVGRVFNAAIALILMDLGIYCVLEAIFGVFAIVAVSWLGCGTNCDQDFESGMIVFAACINSQELVRSIIGYSIAVSFEALKNRSTEQGDQR